MVISPAAPVLNSIVSESFKSGSTPFIGLDATVDSNALPSASGDSSSRHPAIALGSIRPEE
eukprot:12789154-Heterocapsa_arctica.AAC.1